MIAIKRRVTHRHIVRSERGSGHRIARIIICPHPDYSSHTHCHVCIMAHKKEIRRGRVLIILELVIIEVLDHGTDGISLERFAVLTPLLP